MKGMTMTAPNVRALLTCSKCGKISVPFPCEHCGSEDFLKTQTRRVIKPQPVGLPVGSYCDPYRSPTVKPYTHFTFWTHDNKMCLLEGNVRIRGKKTAHWNPSYRPGDVVYVKEGYKVDGYSLRQLVVSGHYLADGIDFNKKLTVEEMGMLDVRKYPYRATPGRFMYRSLARIFEEITDVRVERVQEISEEDARAEGVQGSPISNLIRANTAIYGGSPERNVYRSLWDSINKTHTWESNPWVFVYGLKRRAG